MSFLVTATNGGDFTEFNVPVKLTIGTGDNAVTRPAHPRDHRRAQSETVSIGGFELRPRCSSARRCRMKVRGRRRCPVSAPPATTRRRINSSSACEHAPIPPCWSPPSPARWPSCWCWPRLPVRAAAADPARPEAAAGRRPAGPGRVRRRAAGAGRDVECARRPRRAGPAARDRAGSTAPAARALLRYDALEGTGGRQSVSLALLDAGANGLS